MKVIKVIVAKRQKIKFILRLFFYKTANLDIQTAFRGIHNYVLNE